MRKTKVADPVFAPCALTAEQVRDELNQQGNNVGFVLKPGEQFSYTCADEIFTGFLNTAIASAEADGPVPVEDSDDALVTVVHPDITIWKTPDEQIVGNNGVVEFTIRVKNTGDVEFRRTIVEDELFASCALTAPKVRVEKNQHGNNVGFVLKPGEEFTYTCNDETFGSFTNTAKVTGFWSNMPFTDSDVADVIFE